MSVHITIKKNIRRKYTVTCYMHACRSSTFLTSINNSIEGHMHLRPCLDLPFKFSEELNISFCT